MKHVLSEIWETVHTGRFWIAVVVIALLCLAANLHGESAAPDTVIYNLILQHSKKELLNMGEEYSAYAVIMSFRNSFWFPVLAPMIAAIPYINQFADEWMTGCYYLEMPRIGRSAYAMKKIMSAFLIGCLTMCLGMLLFIGIVMAAFPAYSAFHLNAMDSTVAYFYGSSYAQRLLALAKVLFHMCLLGSIASGISTILLTFVRDRFLSFTFPTLLLYLSTKALNLLVLYIRKNYQDDPPVFWNLIYYFLPSEYTVLDSSFRIYFGISNIFWYLYLILLLFFIYLIFYYIVKRRQG